VNQNHNTIDTFPKNDSSWYSYAGYTKDIKKIAENLGVEVAANEAKGNYSRIYKQGNANVLSSQQISMKRMPELLGMGLKDAVYLCENLGLKVSVKGRGKVVTQSIQSGQNISKGQIVNIQFN
jgi:cell division protein FtsI (penicillin-binding protein 3)